ncbi:MAG TPA: hypothetical protein VGC99_29545 [Candidatus Tectomicrobia bacterium]
MKFLIVGTGRCGTRWATEVLRLAGLHVGHQAVFRHEHVLGAQWSWNDYDGDCSFEAVPMLDRIDARKVLLWRDAREVAASWLSLGLFTDDMPDRYGMFSKVLDEYFPAVLTEATPVLRAFRFWSIWNLYAFTRCDVVLELRHTTPARLADAVAPGLHPPTVVPIIDDCAHHDRQAVTLLDAVPDYVTRTHEYLVNAGVSV